MSSTTQRAFTGRHMLMIMLAFFGIIFAVNFTMVYFAVSSWTGLVVKNSYVASQEFNETTERLEKAAKGFNAEIIYAAGKLTLRLFEKSGKAVSATNVKIKLGRPSHEGEDQEITLVATDNGMFSADHVLAKGQWAGDVSANITGHDNWQRPIRLMVQD